MMNVTTLELELVGNGGVDGEKKKKIFYCIAYGSGRRFINCGLANIWMVLLTREIEGDREDRIEFGTHVCMHAKE
jgi:hypothetical protein